MKRMQNAVFVSENQSNGVLSLLMVLVLYWSVVAYSLTFFLKEISHTTFHLTCLFRYVDQP